MKKSIIPIYFSLVLLTSVLIWQGGRWLHYHGNTSMEKWEEERHVNLDDIKPITGNPVDLTKDYFRKVMVTEVIRTSTFPFLETLITEEDKGIFSKQKEKK